MRKIVYNRKKIRLHEDVQGFLWYSGNLQPSTKAWMEFILIALR